ncbi:MAG: FAD-dependent oxidoreductase [Lentisphaerae bacterium]|nr:FAD-dependent oxidoreductase [Lentisphaerota bacterium]
MSKVLVLGAGIAGCSAALELARQGHRVIIVERSPAIGGKVISYCCKATDECSRCGVCVAHTAISETMTHRGIIVLTGTHVCSVVKKGERFTVSLRQDRPFIQRSKCDNCGLCAEACPEKCITRYDRGGLVYYAIDHSRCRRADGKQCRKCVAACPNSAIVDSAGSENSVISVDAVIVATGHAVFDARLKPEYGYGRIDGVITGEELESVLSFETMLGAKNIAFVQCVGSRDPELGRNYCSSVCCAYAVRMARMLRYACPENSVTIYGIDIQNFDKTFSKFRNDVLAEGVQFVRTVPSSIFSGPDSRPVMRLEGGDGMSSEAVHDMVVLSVGLGPQPDANITADLFGLTRDEWGFFVSAPKGVYVTGTCAEPQSITDAMASARATAADAISHLPAATSNTKPLKRRGKQGKNILLNQLSLVLGGGVAGITTARGIADRGLDVMLVEKSDRIGGRFVSTGANSPIIDLTTDGVEIRTNTEVQAVKGSAGAFTVFLATGTNTCEVKCGAIVICTGTEAPTSRITECEGVMSLAAMCRAVEKNERKNRPRVVGIVLDQFVEETKSSNEFALNCAIRLRNMFRSEVYVFCREVRVNALNLELLYDRARDAGVNVVRYSGAIDFAPVGDQVAVVALEPVLRETITVNCDLVGVSDVGLGSRPDESLIDMFGLTTDAQGQIQDNNVHFFPEMTNRLGVFVVGACRGQYYLADVLRDARVTALSVSAFLGAPHIAITEGTPVVDANKCALCLTCVRSCPHGAMTIDQDKRTAVCMVEACRHCGICAGECPAGAIELR